MKLIAHPDNIALLEKEITHSVEFRHTKFNSIEIVKDQYCPKTKKSGKYILPSGKVVPREQISIPDGQFFEWNGQSDTELKYLLKRGLLREHEESVFYMIDENMLINGFPPIPDYRIINNE